MYKKLLSSFLDNYRAKLRCFSDFHGTAIQLSCNYLADNLFFLFVVWKFHCKIDFFCINNLNNSNPIIMTFRSKAIEVALNRQPFQPHIPAEKVTELYGSNTFSEEVMRTMLSPEAYLKISSAIRTNSTIDREIAEEVAAAMKSWAISRGATHYTHWFQPLTGTTAEKHDSFFDIGQN